MSGTIIKVSGPLVVAEGLGDANVSDVVRVGPDRLIGEILNMTGDSASIQVYEETSGLGPGAEVESSGMPMSVELGPGMLENIYDGIQRPLPEIRELTGATISRGTDVPALNRKKKWTFTPTAHEGDELTGGDVIGTVQETSAILHKIMVPPNMSGKLLSIKGGDFTVTETVAVLEDNKGEKHELTLMQKWPVRISRPYASKSMPTRPMNSGQRIIDTLFPIAKGGTAAVPGPFGSGKTVVQHQLAKWSDVDIVIYIGCGERGNEMTDVLMEFPELTDPRNGEPLMKRTVLIANTSDMPVAAREASIYTGITIAEYFRDMGYDVAVLADSTSRWAEALREMSGRLEEMPGEEGYPAYLASRIARHFPAINWLTSYSLYVDTLAKWYNEQFGPEYMINRDKAMHILQEENELQEIVRLVGQDALSPADRLTMETAKMLREDFLQQNAFVDEDAYSSYDKQFELMRMILTFDTLGRDALGKGADMKALFAIGAKERIGRAKMAAPDTYKAEYASILEQMKNEIDAVIAGGEDA